MKKCPYCAEEIQDDAIKCKYCGEWIKIQNDNEVPSGADTDKLEESPNKYDEENKDALEKKLALSNVVSDCFKQFKKITIIFYIVVSLMVVASLINKMLMPFAFWGYIIILFYYWTNLWSCAKLVGKSPLAWVIISGILSFIGPVIAYNSLRSSAVSQGIIMEYKPVK